MICPFAGWNINAAGNRKNVPSFFQSKVRSNERSASFSRFYNNHTTAHTGYDSIPGRKLSSQGRSTKRIFRNNGASLFHDLMEEIPVFRWIYPVQSEGRHYNSRCPACQRPFMGCAVYSSGTAGNNSNSLFCQPSGKPSGCLHTIGGSLSGTYDGYKLFMIRKFPSVKKNCRWIGGSSKKSRVILLFPSTASDMVLNQFLHNRVRVYVVTPCKKSRFSISMKHMGFSNIFIRRFPYIFCRMKEFNESPHTFSSQPGTSWQSRCVFVHGHLRGIIFL